MEGKEIINGSETVQNSSISKNLRIDMLFDPQADNALSFFLLGVCMTIIGILGVFGNSASIRVLSNKRMRNPVNIILCALGRHSYTIKKCQSRFF